MHFIVLMLFSCFTFLVCQRAQHPCCRRNPSIYLSIRDVFFPSWNENIENMKSKRIYYVKIYINFGPVPKPISFYYYSIQNSRNYIFSFHHFIIKLHYEGKIVYFYGCVFRLVRYLSDWIVKYRNWNLHISLISSYFKTRRNLKRGKMKRTKYREFDKVNRKTHLLTTSHRCLWPHQPFDESAYMRMRFL